MAHNGKRDLYNRKNKLNSVLDKLKRGTYVFRDKKIFELGENRDFLILYDKFLLHSCSVARRQKELCILVKILTMLHKDFMNLTKIDVDKLVEKIDSSDLSASTKNDYRRIIKKFIRWLRFEYGYPNDYPDENLKNTKPDEDELGDKWFPKEVRKVRTTLKTTEENEPDILTPEEVAKLRASAGTLVDRVLISVLFESGARVGELLSMKKNDIRLTQVKKNNKFYPIATLNLIGKTGPRKVMIMKSAPILKEWLNNHPDNNDAYLWIVFENGITKPMTHQRVSMMLKRTAKKAGIRKRMYAHLLRHSRATEASKVHTDAVMRKIFGWSKNSQMPAYYSHLSGRDSNEAIMKENGIANEEIAISPLQPHECINCGFQNESSNSYCTRCSLPVKTTQDTLNPFITEASQNAAAIASGNMFESMGPLLTESQKKLLLPQVEKLPEDTKIQVIKSWGIS